MSAVVSAASFSEDDRFRAAIDWRASARQHNPTLQDIVLDAAFDGLVDLLIKREDLGRSRRAVWALANQQLDWKIASATRRRLLNDGRPRSTPAGAASLDALYGPNAENTRPLEPADRSVDVAETAIRRVMFKQMLCNATREDPLTATIVVGYALGFGPDELEAQTGIRANTITQRKGRFARAHREEIV
jgi:hypothetical protein